MIREVDGGSSHASQNSSILHLAGSNKKIDSLIISWPGGKQYLLNVDSNQLIEINEKISDELSVFEKLSISFIINFFKV